MELKILKEQENTLLKRKDVTARIFFQGATPSRQDIAEELAGQTKTSRDKVIVASIKPAFGETSATVTARLYTDLETMKEVERDNLVEKNKKREPEPEPEPESEAEEATEAAEEDSGDEAPADTKEDEAKETEEEKPSPSEDSSDAEDSADDSKDADEKKTPQE